MAIHVRTYIARWQQVRAKRCRAGIFTAGVLVAGLAALPAWSAQNAETLSGAQQAAQAYVQATVHFDAGALANLLAASYHEISPIGEVDERARVLGFYPAAQQGKTPDVSAELTLWQQQQPIEGLVISSAKLTYKSVKDGSEYPLRVQFVLQQQDGKWRLLSSQYTPIRPKKAKS